MPSHYDDVVASQVECPQVPQKSEGVVWNAGQSVPGQVQVVQMILQSPECQKVQVGDTVVLQ